MGKWLGEKGIQYILCLCDSNSRGTASHPDKGNARAASSLARSSIPQTATRSVTRVDVRIARSRLPIAVSVIVATTGTRIVVPAEGDADPDAKVRTSPEASTVVIALAGVEPARIVTASSTVVSAAGIAAARVPTSSPAAALGQCGRRAKQHQDRAKSKRRHRGFER